MHYLLSRRLLIIFGLFITFIGLITYLIIRSQFVIAEDTVDEIHYSFGSTPDSITINWRGNENILYYGDTSSYGNTIVATPSNITPVDIEGPFMEAKITGLNVGASYHYKIGNFGVDHTFSTAPSVQDSFRFVSTGDTAASSCRPYQPELNALLTAQNPDFVIHGGDISIANECGEPAVHEYYTDIESYSHSAAFMPVWGNHEYGNPTADAPAGTPRDQLANYKGRSDIPNAQIVPNDTPTKTGHPGCPDPAGGIENGCYGEDWGWFKAGRIIFISYPELWPGAITDWHNKVVPVMQQAQNDSNVDFIITYGHRPVLSSTNWTAPTDYESVFSALGEQFGSGSVAGGKYVLNIAQHRHNMEVFDNYHGVMHVVNGGGGQGVINFGTILPNSVFQLRRLGFMTLDYNAVNRELNLKFICGPEFTSPKDQCVVGSTVYEKTFTSDITTTTQPFVITSVTDGLEVAVPSQVLTYDVDVNLLNGDTVFETVDIQAQLPSGVNYISSSNNGVYDAQSHSVTWNTQVMLTSNSYTIDVEVNADVAISEELTINVAVSPSDGSLCSHQSAICQTIDTTTVISSEPTFIQYINNTDIEIEANPWDSVYGKDVNISRDTSFCHNGSASLKAEYMGSTSRNSGIKDSINHVTNTKSGEVYKGSVWVYSNNQNSLRLRLSELQNGSIVQNADANITGLIGNGWQQISVDITAQADGNEISFAVYSWVTPGKVFWLDDFSLTSGVNTEPEPVDETAPAIINIGVTPNITSASASWNTDEAATSKVYVSDVSPVDMATAYTVLDNTFKTTHYLSLTNLTADTTYYYIIESTDLSGNIAQTSEGSYTTNPEPQPTPVSNSVYDYVLDSANLNTVTNTAAANNGVDLALFGDVSVGANGGIHFEGDTVNKMSVGYANPTTGSTLSVGANESVGVATVAYMDDLGGSLCRPDSSNIVQIGRFGDGLSQVKMQLSGCGDSSNAIYLQCRIAGVNTPSGSLPVMGTKSLVHDTKYGLACIKGSDEAGNAKIYIVVVTYGTETVVYTDEYTISASGNIDSSAYLSVANKYTLPSQSSNTDNFNGEILAARVCVAGLIDDVASCLNDNLLKATNSNALILDNTTPPDPVDETAPVISGLSVTSDTTSANVSWNTDEDSSSKIYVSMNSPVNIATAIVLTDNNLKTEHSLNITGLNSGTTYYFVVESSDAAGNTKISAEGSFITLSISNPGVTQYINNTGFEYNINDWQGIWGIANDTISEHETSFSYAGQGSIKVTRVSNKNGTSGFKDDINHVTNTVAGKTYSGSVWVYSDSTIILTLRLSELVNGLIVNDSTVKSVKLNSGWQQINTDIIAENDGAEITFGVYGWMKSGVSFWADEVSLISEQ